LHIRENARKHHRERQPAKTLERGSEQTTTTTTTRRRRRRSKMKQLLGAAALDLELVSRDVLRLAPLVVVVVAAFKEDHAAS
jgi:hypothetical protein